MGEPQTEIPEQKVEEEGIYLLTIMQTWKKSFGLTVQRRHNEEEESFIV